MEARTKRRDEGEDSGILCSVGSIIVKKAKTIGEAKEGRRTTSLLLGPVMVGSDGSKGALVACGSLVASFLSIKDAQQFALASKAIRKAVMPSLSSLSRVKEVWWHGVPETCIPTERFAPYIYPKFYSLHLYERNSNEPRPAQCPLWSERYRGIQLFKEAMGRHFQDHLGGIAPGVPQRLHQVVAFLEQNFEPEEVSYTYVTFYTFRDFFIDVKKGDQTLYLKCEKRASNVAYKSGLFAADNESENDHPDPPNIAEEDESESAHGHPDSPNISGLFDDSESENHHPDPLNIAEEDESESAHGHPDLSNVSGLFDDSESENEQSES
jgi:hypothetical protein